MKGHWIPPSPKGFIDRIAAKLGYSKTIPSGLGTDLVDAVGTLNDQKANKGNIAILASGTDTHSAIIYNNQFVYANGILYQAHSDIPAGTSISGNATIVNGIANKFLLTDNVVNVIGGDTLKDYSSTVTGGLVAITRYGRIAIMTFSDVYFNGVGNLFDLIPNPLLPFRQSEGTLISATGGTPLRVWLRVSGTAGYAGTSSPQGSYSGSVVYITAN